MSGDLSYLTSDAFVERTPPFTADAVMLRGYGEFSWYPTLIQHTSGFPINGLSALTDPLAPTGQTDIDYVISTQLQPRAIKRAVFLIEWYSSSVDTSLTPKPAYSDEVVNAQLTSPPSSAIAGFTSSTGIALSQGSAIYPTLADVTVTAAAVRLASAGVAYGICPTHSYFDHDKELVQRAGYPSWAGLSDSTFSAYLTNYSNFVKHYVDLVTGISTPPWIFYVGYRMSSLFEQVSSTRRELLLSTLSTLAAYVKTHLPHTLVTYAAEFDEAYSFATDPLWLDPNIDFVGLNWWATLSPSYTNDLPTLRTGVLNGEGADYLFDGYITRGLFPLSTSHEIGKTGLNRIPLAEGTGYKDLASFLTYPHFVPVDNSTLAQSSPIGPFPFSSSKNNGAFVSDISSCVVADNVRPRPAGGAHPAPGGLDSFLQVRSTGTATFTLPIAPASLSSIDFTIDFAADGTQDCTIVSFSGFSLYISGGNLTAKVGSSSPYLIDSVRTGTIRVVITTTVAQIYYGVNLLTTISGSFTLPVHGATVSLGTNWDGQIYQIISVCTDAGAAQYGGTFYFDEAYSGSRTGYIPGLIPWMLTAGGYASCSGACVDGFSELIPLAASGNVTLIPADNAHFNFLTGLRFFNNRDLDDIYGPYGSTFEVDEVHQANCLSVLLSVLRAMGMAYGVAFFVDNRTTLASQYIPATPGGLNQFLHAGSLFLSHSLTGKAAVLGAGSSTGDFTINPSIDNLLGLSSDPLGTQLVVVLDADDTMETPRNVV